MKIIIQLSVALLGGLFLMSASSHASNSSIAHKQFASAVSWKCYVSGYRRYYNRWRRSSFAVVGYNYYHAKRRASQVCRRGNVYNCRTRCYKRNTRRVNFGTRRTRTTWCRLTVYNRPGYRTYTAAGRSRYAAKVNAHRYCTRSHRLPRYCGRGRVVCR